MTVTEIPRMLTPAEYLVRERAAAYRSEYVDGRMVLMTGGSRAHSLISGNIAGTLREALRGGPCEVHQSDMRVRVAEGRFYTYPDVVIAREPVELEDAHKDTLLNPTVIIEVLSPSTARFDRGEKRRRYESIASLHHYLVVEQDQPLVEHHRRDDEGWRVEVVEGLDGTIRLGGVGGTAQLGGVGGTARRPRADVLLGLSDVYERVSEGW